ncbi:hypothetical protein [Streptomyces sp. NBC_01304]|uniref:hypothetical protein n=1 Tax=Streptomyces sp. NBC_01304 TaxID=2903818 RepID=UPI002E166399|nr:hypothetical protein OG430_42265 [Streptomyces sp. NBC_01304]
MATSVVGAKEANRDWSLSMDTQETGRQELSKALCDLAPESGSWTAQLYASTLALTRAHLGPVDPLEDDHRAVQLLRSDCWARVGDFNRFSWKPEQEAGATAYTLMPSHDSYADAYVPGLHEPMDKHRV